MTALKLVRKLFTDAHRHGVLPDTWKIVSAMRGPDNSSSEAKRKFTTPFRRTVLTQNHAYRLNLSDESSFAKKQHEPETVQEIAGLDECGGHFESHAVIAARAILKGK